MKFLGVDPGVSGALAVIDDSDKVDFLFEFFDTPTNQIKSGKTFKNVIDPAALTLLLEPFANNSYLVIEKVNAMPSIPSPDGERRSMGATSAFSFGFGFGLWIGVIAALRIPYSQVHPKTWKKAMLPDGGKDKDSSRVRMAQLYPWTAKDLSRKKDHGRADAGLLAEFARRTYIAPQEWNQISPPQKGTHGKGIYETPELF